MTKLQEKLLKLKELREKNAALFAKSDDLATLSAEELASIKSNNTEIEKLDAEVKDLEALEAAKAANTKALESFKHHGGESTKAEDNKSQIQVFSRVTSLKNFKGEVNGKSADERAYRFGKWFAGAVVGIDSAKRYCNDHGIELKAHSEGTNTAGGYLVPHEFSNDLIDLREKYGIARRVAKVEAMASDTKMIARRKTGLTAYWTGEASGVGSF
jgi:HK97 family phage major capsid protein